MKKRGNKRMATPKQKFIHNPIYLLFVCVNILLVKKLSIVPAVSSSTIDAYQKETKMLGMGL